jgi:hypothetical protein
MIPLPFIEPHAGNSIYQLKLNSVRHLLPGQSAGLDTICNGILGRTPFVLGHIPSSRPSELVSR